MAWELVRELVGSQQPTVYDAYFRNSRDLDFRNSLIRNPRLSPISSDISDQKENTTYTRVSTWRA